MDIVLLIVLLILSALFSASETAILSANKIRLRAMASDGDKKAQKALEIVENPDKIISAILIGNNIVNLYASAIATSIAMRIWGSKSIALATGVLTLIVLVFGEVTPKTISTRYSDAIVRKVAGPVSALATILTPAVWLVNLLARALMKLLGIDPDKNTDVVTEEELRAMVEVSNEEGVIEAEEKEMITNVVDFGDLLVKEVMVPRIDMVMVSEDAGYEELLDIFRKEKYTRIPVYSGSPDNIVGMINIKDILLSESKKDFKINDYARKVLYTFEFKRVAELMGQMRRELESIAIVLDEYGVTAGMISMEDIIEEIVGEIRDEYDYDETEAITEVGQNEYLIDGMVKPEEINQRFNLNLDEESNESMAGIVLEKLGHLPSPGECVEGDGYRLQVMAMDKMRIDKIKLFVL